MKQQTRKAVELGDELRIEAKRLIEEARREGVDISVPSNSVSKELAEKIRQKYFPKKEDPVNRAVKVVKKGRKALEEGSQVEMPLASANADVSEVLVTDKEFVHVIIPREQFELLSVRTKEILAETALAQERITKDQGEIDLLKTETREILRRLCAA